MVFPPIHFFQGLKGRTRLSDIEFLAKKEFDGKLVKNEGFLSVIGDLATLTASAGKDMYLARAKCVVFHNTDGTASSMNQEIVLKVNGVIVETFPWTRREQGGPETFAYEFKNIGHKVAATQIIKIEVITLATNMDVEGFIECFEETTGADPTI